MSETTPNPSVERYVLENAAANLLSEDGENPEYDRAIVELVRDVTLWNGAITESKVAIECYLRELLKCPTCGECGLHFVPRESGDQFCGEC